MKIATSMFILNGIFLILGLARGWESGFIAISAFACGVAMRAFFEEWETA